ncbi:MAG TPA: DUF1697 domain-containing protein [Rectinemataceae bacterium]|nr:DUF1697 domain-containing protein [Rectinemataceae bacterium]
MAKYVALIRGINVGGVVLKMDDLRKMLEYIGFSKVRTYIQSGNAIFETTEVNKRKMEAEIAQEIRNKIDREVVVIVRTVEEIARIASAHPLADLGDEKNLYVTVLSYDPAAPDVEVLMTTMNEVDRHEVANRVVYSYYGQGYGNSKRSNNFIEKILKVPATTRNWATMKTLAQMGFDSGEGTAGEIEGS